MNLVGICVWFILFPSTAIGSDRDFEPIQVVPSQPPIERVPFLAATKVRDEVRDSELVLGVVAGEEARAYPINMLTGPSREIINDRLGGRSIAATW